MATELAKAYVQIIPSARGIKGAITSELSGEVNSAGKSASSGLSNILSSGGKVAGVAMAGALAAGVGALALGAKLGSELVKGIGESVQEGAKLEQSIGGIETMFKKNADTVLKQAKEAYKTAGLSANDYMENVTSFSASLLQGLGGNTKKAAKISNMAMIDMSDNANKFGTDLQSIQNAYQGFAKGQFMMLDNLKLGYGGTKTEMARLINDTKVLGDTVVTVGNKGNFEKVVTFDKMIEAIHKMQTELGVTGTTSKEAASTFSGSLASMQSAWQNVLGYIAIGEDVTEPLKAFVQTASTFLFNNAIPMVGRIVKALPGAFSTFFTSAIPIVKEQFSKFAGQFSGGLFDQIPKVYDAVYALVQKAGSTITENLPSILAKGEEMVGKIVDGITKTIPIIAPKARAICKSLMNTLISNLPALLAFGGKIVTKIIDGFVKVAPVLLKTVGQEMLDVVKILAKNAPAIKTAAWGVFTGILQSWANGVKQALTMWGNLGKNIVNKLKGMSLKDIGTMWVKGLILGVTSSAGLLNSAVSKLAQNMIDTIKKKFGIHSPSRVMRDEVGKMLGAGLSIGIDNSTKGVTDSMSNLAKETVNAFDMAPYSGTVSTGQVSMQSNSSVIDYDRLASATAYAISNMSIKVGQREFGRVIREVM